MGEPLSQPQASSARMRIALMLLGILAVAGGLRFSGLGERSFWFDEVWDVELSNGWDSASFLEIPIDRFIPEQANYVKLADARPWHTIPAHMDYVLQPPLFHLLLRPWRAVVGESPEALRGFSALWSLVAVGLMFEAGRRCAGPKVGLGAAAMMALSLSQIDSAHDCRSYALLTAISLPAAIVLQSLLDPSLSKRAIGWRSIAVAFGMLAMMFTHYFAAGPCLGLALFAVIFLRGRARWMTLAGMAIAGMIYLALWLPSLRHQLDCIKETADLFLLDPTPGHGLRTLQRLAALPMTLIANPDFTQQTSAWRMGLGVALLALAALAVLRHGRAAAIWAFWFAGAVGVVTCVDLARHSLHLTFVRYVLLASPGLYLLLAMHLADRGRFGTGATSKTGHPERYSAKDDTRRNTSGVFADDARQSTKRFGRSFGVIVTSAVLALEVALLAGGSAVHVDDVRPLCAYVQQHVRKGDVIVLPARHHLGYDAHALSLYLAYYTDVIPNPMVVPTHAVERGVYESAKPQAAWWVISLTPIEMDRMLPGAKVLEGQTFEQSGGAGVVVRIDPPHAGENPNPTQHPSP